MGSSTNKSRQKTANKNPGRSRLGREEVSPKLETLRTQHGHGRTGEDRRINATNPPVEEKQPTPALIPVDTSYQRQLPDKQKLSLPRLPERQCGLQESTRERNITPSAYCNSLSIISKENSNGPDNTAASESHHHDTSSEQQHRVKRKQDKKRNQQSGKEENSSQLLKGSSREKHHHYHVHHHRHDSGQISRPMDLKKSAKKAGVVEMIRKEASDDPVSAGGRSSLALAEQDGATYHKYILSRIPSRHGETSKLNRMRSAKTAGTSVSQEGTPNQNRQRAHREADQKAATQTRKEPRVLTLSKVKDEDNVSARVTRESLNEPIRYLKESAGLIPCRENCSRAAKDIDLAQPLINRKPSGATQSGRSRPLTRTWETNKGGKQDQGGGRGQLIVLVGPLRKRSLPRQRPTTHDVLASPASSRTPPESLSSSTSHEWETESNSTVSWVPAARGPRKDPYRPLARQMPSRVLIKEGGPPNLPRKHKEIVPHGLPSQRHTWTRPDASLSHQMPSRQINCRACSAGSDRRSQLRLVTSAAKRFAMDKKSFSGTKRSEKKNNDDGANGGSHAIGLLRKYKNKLGLIFHHHHHHHHHHHDNDVDPKHYHHHHHLLRGLFHMGKKNEPTRSVVQKPPADKEHGHLYRLLAAFLRYILHPRKAAADRRRLARTRMMMAGGRWVKKLHWWQKIYRRGGVRLANRKKPLLRLPLKARSQKPKTVTKH